MKRIVAVAGDAGGATALLPVLRALATMPDVELKLTPYRQAVGIWSKLGLAIEPLPDDAAGDDASTWEHLAPAHLVVTGTSVNGVNQERAAVRWAARSGVPSLSVLDFWSNYAARFRDTADAPLELPTTIAVMDERARDDMLAEGFPADRLVVTGQPAFDGIAEFRAHWTDSMRCETRRELREELANADGSIVLFASQPLAEMSALTQASGTPINERDVLDALVASLDAIATDDDNMVLVVRPHPREEIDVSEIPNAGRARVVVSRAGRPWAAALAADVVVGMTSVFLLEAALLGCNVVSIQPDQQHADPLPALPDARLTRVYDLGVLTQTLRQALGRDRTSAAAVRPSSRSHNPRRIAPSI